MFQCIYSLDFNRCAVVLIMKNFCINAHGLKFSSGIFCLGVMAMLVSENELGIIPSVSVL